MVQIKVGPQPGADGSANPSANPAPIQPNRPSTSSEDSGSLVNLSSLSLDQSPSAEYEHVAPPSPGMTPTTSPPADRRAKLLYCKSHVSIHPTAFNKDNISGYLGIVEVEGNSLLVTWTPDELLERMDEKDREGFKRVDGKFGKSADKEEDGFVFVSLPPPRGEKYAFSVPVSSIYSVLVYPPSLSHWYGSATFNLAGGVSLPTLFFHDDESPLLSSPPTLDAAASPPRPQWGFPPFLALLQSHSSLLQSRLVTPRQNQGAELWLINPSKSDREVHEAGYEEPATTPPRRSSATRTSVYDNTFPPKPQLPNLSVIGTTTPRQSFMTSLSKITSFSREAAKEILSIPLVQPVVPHLPPAVRSLVSAPGEWERSGRMPKSGAKSADVATEFESARLYLARWARVVAEEGERARRNEVAAQADLTAGERVGAEDLASSLGVFSLLTSPNSKRPIPHPTRTPQHPITTRDWASYSAQGRDEGYVRREIFRRGFSDSPEEKLARREGWEVLLGIVPWDVGGVGGTQVAIDKRRAAREAAREAKRKEYESLRDAWRGQWAEAENGESEGSARREAWREEWHRIDVDCRRTDRNQPIFAVPEEAVNKGEEEKEAGGAGGPWDTSRTEENGMAGLNRHIAALRLILMTYHTYSPALGYVQGMSDLLSPLYVVFEANEGDAFWGLVGVMKMMESNFLRDQSGMKRQLSTLQQLIGVMDPELYAHLGDLNLFFCFRWILIAFKREFKFDQVIRLWEVLWTNCYSNQFVLFVALAILQSHRDVIIRYLAEFDEVLKYANDLSGTIDLDTTLAQAEVLFLSFRGLIEDLDRKIAAEAESSSAGLRKRRGSGVSVRSENGKVGRDVSELRSLLVAWPEQGRGEAESEQAIGSGNGGASGSASTWGGSQSRRGSGLFGVINPVIAAPL